MTAPNPQLQRDVLIADDDATLRERLARALRERGFEVRTAANHKDAMAMSRERAPRFALVDLRMPGPNGLDLIRDLKALAPDARVILLTGYGSIATAVDAIRLGAHNVLSKPADADEVVAALLDEDGRVALPDGTGIPAPSLARAEWEHIHRVLADCSGNISEASRRLGIHRRSLQRKLKKIAPD